MNNFFCLCPLNDCLNGSCWVLTLMPFTFFSAFRNGKPIGDRVSSGFQFTLKKKFWLSANLLELKRILENTTRYESIFFLLKWHWSTRRLRILGCSTAFLSLNLLYMWPANSPHYLSSMQANSIWLYIVPGSMRSLMNYVKDRYNTPPVYITENGKYRRLSWDR